MKVINSDYSSLESTNCFCSPESANQIRSSITSLPLSAVHLIGTGDYHYVSLFWLERIEEKFALILFDNHPDDQAGAFGDKILSCGNWISRARELPNLKNEIWIRKLDDAEKLSTLDKIPLYFSIDLDILSKDYAHTDWDQGDMQLGQLKDIIISLSKSHRIIGVDICGGLSTKKGAFPEDFLLNEATEKALCDLF